jgi:hypothetical protein
MTKIHGRAKEKGGGATMGPFTSVCAHRWVDAPPSSGSTPVRTHGGRWFKVVPQCCP